MFLLKCTDRFQSVHPQLKNVYIGRFWYNLSVIPAFFSIFHELGYTRIAYIAFFLLVVIWPHLAFYIAATSRNPKRTEALGNHVFEFALVGFMLPALHFNPFIIMLACIGLGTVAFTDRPTLWRIIGLRSAGFLIALGLGMALFGIHFETNISLRTTIAAGGYLITFTYINLITAYITTRKITTTRQDIKAALEGRNRAYAKLNEELKIAESYVRHMLPAPIKKGPVQTKWRFHPTAMLGGDAFGYYWLDRDHFIFYLLDVSGHGIGAALLSVSVLNDLRLQTLQRTDFRQPRQVLSALNTAFPSEKHDDMFFTIWYGAYNASSRMLKYASAGHPPAIVLGGSRTPPLPATVLKNPNSVIGVLPGTTFHENAIQVRGGSSLYLFSDGVYEIRKPDGSMWPFADFQSYLQKIDPGKQSRVDQLYTHVRTMNPSRALDDDFSILEIVFA